MRGSLPSLVLLVCVPLLAAAQETVFFDDFQDGDAEGWSGGGQGDVAINDYQGSRTLRLTRSAYAVAEIDVAGLRRVTVGAAFAANDLESEDRCLLQLSFNGGDRWQTTVRVVDGQDDNFTLHAGFFTAEVPADAGMMLLVARVAGDGADDTCYLDNVFVRSVVSDARKTPKPRVSRQLLTSDAPIRAPMSMSEFGPGGPTGAEPHAFVGRLQLYGPVVADGFELIYDEHGRMDTVGDVIRRLPEFDFGFVSRGGDLIPLRQGVIRREHPYWEIALQPGKVWRRKEDGPWSRAAIPFALQERSANCTHNGVMTWLYDGDGRVSNVAFQISSETCAYFKFDLWGKARAAYSPTTAGEDEAAAIARVDRHAAARLPIRPLAALAEAWPGSNTEGLLLADGVNPADVSVYGFLVDGVHYRGGCETRHGIYPYCDVLPLPSYSTAKTMFAGVGLMRAEHLAPGISQRTIASVIPECDLPRWEDVTIEDALDMATGNFSEPGPTADEDSAPHLEFVFSDSHGEKLEFSCGYFERRAEPGTTFAYHTSDTYLVGVALQRLLDEVVEGGSDVYADLLTPLWRRLRLSPLLDVTKRTYDQTSQPFAGYGLTVEADDWLRIADWLANRGGSIDGEPMLDPAMLDAALQRDPDDRGVFAGNPTLRYNNSMWAFNVREVIDCEHDIWIPFMSGFGGITIAMMPNGVIFYYASDGYVHRWRSAVRTADTIEAMCR
ncbi:serine hydrolase domain-containing protein [Lentisalinibacter sediminis]|uniref:hypothetical protein n=1 Tax=Lentisalinibacter sediminis TaxID=2992237 RepID=UPI00386CABF2